MPRLLLAHSYASASVVTNVLLMKYVDAMPLYRQEQMWKRMGVELKRGTMANWVIQVADLYLRPFWKRIRSELLTQSTIHADETVMQVHKEKERPDTSESRMWVYSSAKRADIQLRCFEYRESRSGKWAKTFLEGFKGVLITDGYGGYNKVQDAEHAGCRAHMRRKWLDAMPEGADAKTCKAAQGYEFCNRLFELERQFEELTAEERLMQRREKSGSVLEAYWTWLNTIPRPTGKLKDAVTYAQNQKAHLCAFLDHGEIESATTRLKTPSALLSLAGRDGSLLIHLRVRRRVRLSIRSWKRQKPTACGWTTICSICSACCLSAQSSARTLRLMIYSPGQKK